MLDVRKIAALPMRTLEQDMVRKVRSYPFYVMYGLGFSLEFCFKNYISHFGEPRFIVDRAKGGSTYQGIPVVASLEEIVDRGYCVIVTAPSYCDELVDVCRRYLPEEAIIPYAGELTRTAAEYPMFLLDNEEHLQELYEGLADDESRRIMEVWLRGRVTMDMNLFLSIMTPNPYANETYLSEEWQRYAGYKETLPMETDRSRPQDAHFTTGIFPWGDEVFYDIGAAYGDTIGGFFRHVSGRAQAVAVELVPEVAVRLETFCKEHGYPVEVVNCGVSDREGSMAVEGGKQGGSSIDASSGLSQKDGTEVKITTIDRLVRDTGKVPTFLKMDIEGMELPALQGACHTIREYRPKLAICLYHKPEDIVEIPGYIRSLQPDYRLYLRHFSNSSSELVLFAV